MPQQGGEVFLKFEVYSHVLGPLKSCADHLSENTRAEVSLVNPSTYIHDHTTRLPFLAVTATSPRPCKKKLSEEPQIMARRTSKGGVKKQQDTNGDLVMGNGLATPQVPDAQLANGNEDPMDDPLIDPEDDEEEMFEPELDEEEDEDDDEEEDGDALEGEVDDESDVEMDDGVPLGRELSPSAVPLIGRDLTGNTPSTTAPSDITSLTNPNHASITVEKPTPYTYDAGHLLIGDPNPLPQTTPATLELSLIHI